MYAGKYKSQVEESQDSQSQAGDSKCSEGNPRERQVRVSNISSEVSRYK